MTELDLPPGLLHAGVTAEAVVADERLRQRLSLMGATNFVAMFDPEKPRPAPLDAADEIHRILDALEAGDFEERAGFDDDDPIWVPLPDTNTLS